MSIEETLLGAALEAGLGLAAKAGLEDEVHALYEQLSRSSERERLTAFRVAYGQAVEAYRRVAKPEAADLELLLQHRPFQEEVVIKLLDPLAGCDLESVSREWGARLPGHSLGLNRFFKVLENALTNDPVWGGLLEPYQELRANQKILDALAQHNLPGDTRTVVQKVAELNGSGAMAVGNDNKVVGQNGVLIENYVQHLAHITIEKLIIQQVMTPVEKAPVGEPELKAYFRALAAECGELPLGMIDGKFTSKEALSLKDVYIDLDVLGVRWDHEKELHLIKRELERPEGGERVALLEAIAGKKLKRMVLLGVAGSGKTTFTNYLSYVLANAYAEDQGVENLPETLRGLLPVRLVLRKAAGHIPLGAECGKAEMLWNALEEEVREQLGAGYRPAWERLQQEMRAGRSLVLLDGLDEVPEAGERRGCLLQAVEAFLKGLPKTQRVLLTARPYAYANPEWQLKGCEVFNLAPLSPEQVGRFVKQWYWSVRGSVNLDEGEAAQRAQQLAAAIEGRAYLADLASRPLLLTQMALVHSERKELPEDRADLYEKTVDLLLVRWQRSGVGNQKLAVGDQKLEVDLGLIRAALAELAYQTHRRQRGMKELEGPGDIPFGDLLAGFVKKLPRVLPTDLTAYLENRTGLLVEREPGTYCFAHRSFQEYLAACHLLDASQELSADLRKLVDEDAAWWREVILLAIGKVRQGSLVSALDLLRNALLADEIEQCPKPEANDWRAAALGGLGLAELRVRERQSELAELPRNLPRARRWLVALLEKSSLPARERVEAGNALAALGDPRFDAERWYLPKDEMIGFVRIPGGVFRMGSNPERDPQSVDREQPQHSVEVSEFYIQRYPVTVAQFGTFVGQSGYSPRDPDCLKGTANHPVVNVDWNDAVAYCAWLDGKLRENVPEDLRRRLEQGWRVRLPSEAEREKAARGTDGRIYPWGDEFDPERANTIEGSISGTSPVGSFPGDLSPYGVLDMAGNVVEWCADWYDEKAYAGRASKLVRDPHGPEKGESRTLRGCSWGGNSRGARCAGRDRRAPGYFNVFIGFRLVLSLAFSGF